MRVELRDKAIPGGIGPKGLSKELQAHAPATNTATIGM